MLWIAQNEDNKRIFGIYKSEDAARDAWGDREDVYIYNVNSDL